MRKHMAMLVVLCFLVLMLQTTGAFAETQYYSVGIDPVQAERTLQPQECMGKWNFPIPGQMGTKTGFRGDKSLTPLTPLIFPESYNGGVIPERQELTIYMCGNGFKLLASLDTMRAVSVECYQETKALEFKFFLSDAPYAPSMKEQVREQLVQEVNQGLSTPAKIAIGSFTALGIYLIVKALSKKDNHSSPPVRLGPTVP